MKITNVKLNEKVNLLLKQLLQLEGDKIVTILNEEGSHQYDIDENGVIGYSPVHAAMFARQLGVCFTDEGVVMIRQFTEEKLEKEHDGRIIPIPIKNLFACKIIHGEIRPLSKEELMVSHCTDARTGEFLEPEFAVNYCDWSF